MITQSPLANADLLREQAWLNGEWVDADSGETFPVTNPATGEELAERAADGRGRDPARARGGRGGVPGLARAHRRGPRAGSCAAGPT